jgi:hypothetical protein
VIGFRVVRLSELLLADQVVDPVTVEDVLEAQAVYGGGFDTNLLELGVVDERRLQPYLERAYGLANRIDVLGEPAPRAIERLPRRQAETFRVVPFRLSGRTLDLIVADPTDVRALDEVGLITGHRIQVNVATEARVHWHLHRAYHLPLPGRLASILEGRVRPRPARRSQPFAAQAAPPDVSLDVIDPPPMPHPIASPVARAYSISRQMPAVAPPALAREVLAPQTFVPPPDASDPALYSLLAAQLQTVTDRVQIPPIALGFLGRLLPRAVLFAVRRTECTGWGASGPRREAVSAVAFTLDSPSVFARVAARGEPYLGELPQGPIEQRFVAALGAGAWPAHVLLVPVTVKGRCVALLYGEAETASARAAVREPFGLVAALVGEAFLRLVVARKLGK